MKRFLVTFVICFTLTSGIFYFWIHRVTKKIFVQSASQASTPLPSSIKGYFETKTPFTVLVLGYGGGKHDGAYLTDTMIVVHVDPKSEHIFLVSIPRDIWIKIPTEGSSGTYWKLNAAYSLGLDDRQFPNKLAPYKGEDGAGRLAEYSVGEITGLTIPYFIGLDFSGFTHSIDTLGGVDIHVNPSFTDPVYPIEGKEAELCGHSVEEIPILDIQAATSSAELVYPCRYETLHFDLGLQHMDGATALKYVRSRHSKEDGSDFGRTKRQQKLILAVKQKIMPLGFITKAIQFIRSLGDDLKTDLTLDDLTTLAQNASTLNGYTVSTLALTDQNYLINTLSEHGQNILVSKDGQDNWESVHTWLTNTFDGKPVPALPIVKVVNATNSSGLALDVVEKLKALHFQTVPVGSSPTSTKTKIVAYDTRISSKELNTLKLAMNVSTVEMVDSAAPSAYNILVVVGSDYLSTMTPNPR